MPEGPSVLWGGRAREESRMGTMGRKDPWAGRPAPVESAVLPPGCVTLGKSLPLSGWKKGGEDNLFSETPFR